MHKEANEFLKRVRFKYPAMFRGKAVIDIGSLDINGNNRHLFTYSTYFGIDIGPGPNVDKVYMAHRIPDSEIYDVVVSTECFEHDKFYNLTLPKCVELLKPGGIFVFTCASDGRKEHGTKRSNSAHESPFSNEMWDDYYMNLNESDIRVVINPDVLFSDYCFEYNPESCDLYFYGIKRNG